MSTPNCSIVLKTIRNLIKLNPDKNIQIMRDNAVKLETRTWENGIKREVLFTVEGGALRVVTKYVKLYTDVLRECVFDLLNVQAASYFAAYDNDILFENDFVKADDALALMFEFLRERGIRNYLTNHNMYSYAVAYEQQLNMLVEFKYADRDSYLEGNMATFATAFGSIKDVSNLTHKRAIQKADGYAHPTIIFSSIGVTRYADVPIEMGITASGKRNVVYIKLRTDKYGVYMYIELTNGIQTTLKELYDTLYPYVNAGITNHTTTHLNALIDAFKVPIYSAPESLKLCQWSKLILVTPTVAADSTWVLNSDDLTPGMLNPEDLDYIKPQQSLIRHLKD